MQDSILQTVDRALHILEILSEGGLTATEIQNRLNLNKSTVHRLMMTLMNKGFVERDEHTNVFSIGIKLVEISSIRLNQVEIKTEAAPYLHGLANKFNQSVQLAIYDNGEAVFIEKVEKYQSMHMYCQIGRRIPVYCSAVGKALILKFSDQEIIDILNRIEFVKFTDKTRMNPMAVLNDIREAREIGYTKDDGEHEKGVHCIAMPIYDYRGEIVASASITGFSDDIYGDAGQEKREALAYTCEMISKRLGYVQPINK